MKYTSANVGAISQTVPGCFLKRPIFLPIGMEGEVPHLDIPFMPSQKTYLNKIRWVKRSHLWQLLRSWAPVYSIGSQHWWLWMHAVEAVTLVSKCMHDLDLGSNYDQLFGPRELSFYNLLKTCSSIQTPNKEGNQSHAIQFEVVSRKKVTSKVYIYMYGGMAKFGGKLKFNDGFCWWTSIM